jgi:transcriptional regulator with XRE-family HTH domain
MNSDQLLALLKKTEMSQRGAARRIGINERTMRSYVSGDARIPRTVALALERVRIDREHAALLSELTEARDAMHAPFGQTTRKLRAIAAGRSRENPTLEELRTAADAMDRFETVRKRFKQFCEDNLAAYLG